MRILTALSRFPYPALKGDQLRAFYQLRELSRKNEVHLICLSEEARPPVEALKEYCASVTVVPLSRLMIGTHLLGGAFNRLPFQTNYFLSGKFKETVAQVVQNKAIEICYVQLARLGENIPFGLNCGYVLDYMDAMSVGMAKRAALSNWVEKPVFAAEAARMRRYEENIAPRFDGLTIISEADRSVFSPEVQKRIEIVPNGVDPVYFSPATEVKRDIDLVFTGNMNYHPNILAARYLVKEILPLLLPKYPRLNIYLVGANPTREILSFASERVTVTGFVPEIRPFLSRSLVFVAPLFSGAGLQNKLLEAMAAGLPVVASPAPAAALGGEHDRHLLVADTPETFANAISRLLENPSNAAQLGQTGRNLIANHFDWGAFNDRLEQLFQQISDSRKAGA